MRRPNRLLAVFGAVCIFYVFIIAIPKLNQPTRVAFEYVKGSYDWSALPQRHPVASITRPPGGAPRKLPKVQHDFSSDKKPSRARLAVLAERRAAVKAAFEKSWKAYKTHAWMHDELEPVSGGKKDPFGGWAATLVDTLDTLWLIGSTSFLLLDGMPRPLVRETCLTNKSVAQSTSLSGCIH